MIVLDSCALLAVLLGERGAQNVADVFPQAVISAVTLAEVLSKAEQRGLDSEQAHETIMAFGIGVLPVEALHARIAAKISRAPRKLDLSLGDRLCMALAIAQGVEFMTSDSGIAAFRDQISIKSFR
ncbi:MAG TPA: PIN domain-containing protein [Rhizomicrobium sp.]